MKRIISCFILIMLSIILITGCGNSLKAHAGTYRLEYSKYVGDPDTVNNTSYIETLTLNADGTGKSIRDGLIMEVEWKMEGNHVYLVEIDGLNTIKYNGTFVDGKLDVFNGDENDDLTIEKVYNKE